MNKTQLVESMASTGRISKKESRDFLDTFIKVVTKALKKGDNVQIVGFGKFEVKYRKPRHTYNPLTGTVMHVKASTIPSFKPGKTLKSACTTAR